MAAALGALASIADRARRGGSGALNPQSALAGLNSPPRGSASGRSARPGRRWSGSRAVSAREPGQVRKEAALSDHRQAQRALPDRSRGRRKAPDVRVSTWGARSMHQPAAAPKISHERLSARSGKPGGTLAGHVGVVRVEHVVAWRPRCSPGRRRRRASMRPASGADRRSRGSSSGTARAAAPARGWARPPGRSAA